MTTTRLALLLGMCLLFASVVRAQTPTPIGAANGIAFTASADHSVLLADGTTDKLSSYEVRFAAVAPSSSCTPVSNVSIGKPALVAGEVSIKPFAPLGALPANCAYTYRIAAIGPGGEGVSAASLPFVRVVPTAPAAPAGVPRIN